MFNPYRAYRRSQEIQYEWIREHPVQWLTLNAVLLAAFIAYIEYKDRPWKRSMREFENKLDTEQE